MRRVLLHLRTRDDNDRLSINRLIFILLIVIITLPSSDCQHLYRALRGLSQAFSATNSGNFAGLGALNQAILNGGNRFTSSDNRVAGGGSGRIPLAVPSPPPLPFVPLVASPPPPVAFASLVASPPPPPPPPRVPFVPPVIQQQPLLPPLPPQYAPNPIDNRRHKSGRTGVVKDTSPNSIYDLRPLQSIIIEPASNSGPHNAVQPAFINRVDIQKYREAPSSRADANRSSITTNDNNAPLIRRTSELFDKNNDNTLRSSSSINKNRKIDQSQDFATNDNPAPPTALLERILTASAPAHRRGRIVSSSTGEMVTNPRVTNLGYHARNPFLLSSAKYNNEFRPVLQQQQVLRRPKYYRTAVPNRNTNASPGSFLHRAAVFDVRTRSEGRDQKSHPPPPPPSPSPPPPPQPAQPQYLFPFGSASAGFIPPIDQHLSSFFAAIHQHHQQLFGGGTAAPYYSTATTTTTERSPARAVTSRVLYGLPPLPADPTATTTTIATNNIATSSPFYESPFHSALSSFHHHPLLMQLHQYHPVLFDHPLFAAHRASRSSPPSTKNNVTVPSQLPAPQPPPAPPRYLPPSLLSPLFGLPIAINPAQLPINIFPTEGIRLVRGSQR